MVSQGHALSRDELVRALVAHTGITTTDGALTNDSLVDAALIGYDQRKIVEKTILISSGDSNLEDAAATAFNPVTGEITVSPAFSNQILAGTVYRIINISTVELDVINILARIGTNLDPAGTTTLFAWLARIWAGLLSAAGLCYGGTVTDVPGANQFTIDALAGLGAGKFADVTAPYRAFVLRDAGGAGGAPQGEMQAITAYVTATGIFTAPGFGGGGVAVDDEVLILHPRLAEILDTLTLVTTIDTKIGVPAVDIATDIANALAALSALIGVPAVDLATDIANALAAVAALIGVPVADLATDIASVLAAVNAIDGSFQEQADTAVNITAIAASETDVLNLAVATTRYIVRSLRLKCANPGANIVTVRLYELVNDVATVIQTFDITAANFGTYFSLMDMFGLPHLTGDNLRVTVQASGGGPYAVTGQYSHATAT